MLFNNGELIQDGFVAGFVILLENGLVLKTESVLWSSEEEKEKIRQKFDEFVTALKSSKDFEYSVTVQQG